MRGRPSLQTTDSSGGLYTLPLVQHSQAMLSLKVLQLLTATQDMDTQAQLERLTNLKSETICPKFQVNVSVLRYCAEVAKAFQCCRI